MNPLLREPTYPEAALLDITYDVYTKYHDWPTFQYVEHGLYTGQSADALTILKNLPRVTIQPAGVGSYGWIRSSGHSQTPQPDDTLALTIAGLSRIPQAGTTIQLFLNVLAYLVAYERAVKPNPTKAHVAVVTSGANAQALSGPGAWLIGPSQLARLSDHLQSEPSTWMSQIQTAPDGSWTIELSSVLRRYANVDNVIDYVNRVVEQIDPHLFRQAIDNAQSKEPHGKHDFHFFISHASEDKDEVARPLYAALVTRGYRVWFDEAELHVGDSLTRSIDQGLNNCDHGVVILSRAFFGKGWPEYELTGLVQRLTSGDRRVLLPVWHGVTDTDVRNYSASLADIVAAISAEGIEVVADKLVAAISGHE